MSCPLVRDPLSENPFEWYRGGVGRRSIARAIMWRYYVFVRRISYISLIYIQQVLLDDSLYLSCFAVSAIYHDSKNPYPAIG